MALAWIIAAIWSGIIDGRYITAGGKRASPLETALWATPPFLFTLLFIVLATRAGFQANWDQIIDGIVNFVMITLPAYFCIYQVRRWFVRRKNPLAVASS
jgi:hypothetical protein